MEVSLTQIFDRPLRGREFFAEIIRLEGAGGEPGLIQIAKAPSLSLPHNAGRRHASESAVRRTLTEYYLIEAHLRRAPEVQRDPCIVLRHARVDPFLVKGCDARNMVPSAATNRSRLWMAGHARQHIARLGLATPVWKTVLPRSDRRGHWGRRSTDNPIPQAHPRQRGGLPCSRQSATSSSKSASPTHMTVSAAPQ
jgi:hypothetical protein